MSEFYSAKDRQREVTRADLEKDVFFACFHDDKWRRVRVNSQLDEYTVAVRFVDHGDFSMTGIDNLQLLWSHFRNLPMQAVNACLAGMSRT